MRLALLLALAAAARGAAAATIRGLVDVQLDLKPPEPRAVVSDLGMGGPRELPDRKHSVVYLEEAPRGAFEEPVRGLARLDQRGEAFFPYVLAVGVGTTVEFPNNDATYHNVFSLSKPKRFDLGRYARGQSKSVLFDRPGVVRVFCEIHSHMSAFVLVFAHRFFAVTEADGSYRIEGVPPGSYRLVVWTDGRVRETRGVHVAADAASVEADFVVR